MRIDIGGSGKVAVTEPFLNLLHGDAVGQQQTGAAMTKIVIANTPLSLLISSDVNADGVINNEDAQAVIDQITGIYAA